MRTALKASVMSEAMVVLSTALYRYLFVYLSSFLYLALITDTASSAINVGHTPVSVYLNYCKETECGTKWGEKG